MIRYALALACMAAFATTAASAKCSDDIKQLQSKAAATDAVTKPGNQNSSSTPGTVPSEGGGQASASAKVLEAQAHDQKGDEAECLKAVEAAKAATR